MCGIAGIFSKNKENYLEKVTEMTDTLAHRGPDSYGYFSDERCFLGHRRLSVLDTSENANQPFYSSNKRYVIVYNGEVYNFKELAAKYSLKPSTTSDTEIIIELFRILGPEFVDELNGMFAIAIYDQAEKELYLFRDRIGIKPLYYFMNDSQFAFASELKALKVLLDKQVVIDREAIGSYLHFGYVPEPKTIFKNVRKFGSGFYGKISQTDFELTQYWNSSKKINKETISDEKAAKKELEELLFSSIEYRMISDVPLGTFLSGGTDSSLVTALAQKISDKPVKTFSIGFKEARFNESIHAKEVANYLKNDHYEYILSESMAIERVSRLVHIYDEPFADSSAIPTQLVAEMARKEVTVALSGDGGDELFMGYGMYTWANQLANPFIRNFRKPIGSILSRGGNREKRAARLFKYDDPSKIKSHIFSQEQYFFSESEIYKLLIDNSYLNSEETNSEISRDLYADEEQAFFDLNYYLKDDLLVKVDRASMAHSLEVRVPLLDHSIVEYALNIDRGLKIKDGVSKYLLKEILYDHIPKKLLERPKRGFSIPLAKWLKEDLKSLVDTYLSEEIITSHNILRYEEIKKLVDRFYQGEDFHFNRIWALIVLNMWLENNKM